MYTKRYPKHLFDESQGWQPDPSLRVECFDSTVECCPSVEITSNSFGSTFWPQLMGTYFISKDFLVSGRRYYKHQDKEYYIYLHDWGPQAGMEWTFATQLGDPSQKTITSANVENAFPLNLCLTDSSKLASFNVWDGRKWRSDPTLTLSCTFFY